MKDASLPAVCEYADVPDHVADLAARIVACCIAAAALDWFQDVVGSWTRGFVVPQPRVQPCHQRPHLSRRHGRQPVVTTQAAAVGQRQGASANGCSKGSRSDERGLLTSVEFLKEPLNLARDMTIAIPSTTPRQVTSHGSSPPPCMAQLASRESADSALLAWTVVSEPPCPGVEGLQQVGRFAAAHLADDDVIGPVPEGVTHEVTDTDGPLRQPPVPRTGRSSGGRCAAPRCPRWRRSARRRGAARSARSGASSCRSRCRR